MFVTKTWLHASVGSKMIRFLFTILILGTFSSVSGQKKFDSARIEQSLLRLPRQANQIHSNDNIIKAIEAVDRKYRQITDTLFGYKSLRHTILQTVLIETNDSVVINPLTFGDKLKTSSIIFNHTELNAMVDRISNSLTKDEKQKFYTYLKANFDNFSTKDRKLNAQPVRIKYVKFYNDTLAQVGIDIYGTHYLWTIDKSKDWDVTKIEVLWVY